MINWNDLKIFEAVAAHENFTKAAEAMNTVQSNVTARIKVLEEEFKVSLFRRTSRTVSLTEEGRRFMLYCKKVSLLTEQIRQDLTANDELSGALRIGSIETTMALNVPGIINHFTNRHPKVALTFKSGNSPTLIEEVINYQLDGAFVAAPVVRPGLNTQLIKKEKLLIVTSSGQGSLNEYIKRGSVKIVVFDQGCSYRPRLEVWLTTKGVIQYQCIEMNTLEGIINFVEAGVGISILPKDVIDELYYNRNLKTYPVSGELGELSTIIIYRNDTPPSRSLEAFLKLF